MWIGFKSTKRYAIKIYSGNTNAISGRPEAETSTVSLHRFNLLEQNDSPQDFVILPQQKWLDCKAIAPERSRQFTPLPISRGTLIDTEDAQAAMEGLRFEITRLDRTPPESGFINITVKNLNPPHRVFAIKIRPNALVEELVEDVEDIAGLRARDFGLYYRNDRTAGRIESTGMNDSSSPWRYILVC